MLKTIAIRVALGVLTLWAVSILIFGATEILPGDVASAVLGQGATPETLAVFRHELGLDRPAYVRYLEWFFNALHGDLGIAMTNKRVIVETIAPRLSNTLFLAGYAALIAVPTSVVRDCCSDQRRKIRRSFRQYHFTDDDFGSRVFHRLCSYSLSCGAVRNLPFALDRLSRNGFLREDFHRRPPRFHAHNARDGAYA